MAAKDGVCINGQWKDGVCVCSRGYENDLERSSNAVLNPIYCSKLLVTIITEGTETDLDERILHYAAMAFTVVCATYCLLGLMSVFASLAETYCHHIMKGRAQKELENYQRENASYTHRKPLDALLWTPPADKYKCIAGAIK